MLSPCGDEVYPGAAPDALDPRELFLSLPLRWSPGRCRPSRKVDRFLSEAVHVRRCSSEAADLGFCSGQKTSPATKTKHAAGALPALVPTERGATLALPRTPVSPDHGSAHSQARGFGA